MLDEEVIFKDWDGQVAACRAWWDANIDKEGFRYCCAAVANTGQFLSLPQIIMANTVEDKFPVTVEIEGVSVTFTPYAEAFKTARKLAGITAIMSTVIFMY